MRTALGFSPGCKNRGSLRLYESCEEDEDAVVEVLAVVSAIKAKKKLEKILRKLEKAWRRATMVDDEREIPKSVKP